MFTIPSDGRKMCLHNVASVAAARIGPGRIPNQTPARCKPFATSSIPLISEGPRLAVRLRCNDPSISMLLNSRTTPWSCPPDFLGDVQFSRDAKCQKNPPERFPVPTAHAFYEDVLPADQKPVPSQRSYKLDAMRLATTALQADPQIRRFPGSTSNPPYVPYSNPTQSLPHHCPKFNPHATIRRRGKN